MEDNVKPNPYGSPAAFYITVLLAVIVYKADAIIDAVRKPVDNPPVEPVSDFSSRVAAAFDGTEEDRAELVANYEARIKVLRSDLPIKDTSHLADIWLTAATLLYDQPRYGGDKFDGLWSVVYRELVSRGLLALDANGDGRPDKALPVSRDLWAGLYGELIEGLQ